MMVPHTGTVPVRKRISPGCHRELHISYSTYDQLIRATPKKEKKGITMMVVT